jgi:hypothetical protein
MLIVKPLSKDIQRGRVYSFNGWKSFILPVSHLAKASGGGYKQGGLKWKRL